MESVRQCLLEEADRDGDLAAVLLGAVADEIEWTGLQSTQPGWMPACHCWRLVVEGKELFWAIGKGFHVEKDALEALAGVSQGIFQRRDKAEARITELLGVVARLGRDSISPEEADELRCQIAVLIAEVGTLRSQLRED